MKKSIVFVLLMMIAIAAICQDSITLHINDDAPALKYSKWLKGTPVTSFDNNRLYVLEFWATWCGPCIAAMPGLSKLAEKYKDNATFIGVNVWERTEDKPYESSLPAVTRFVDQSGSRMRYNVIADNNPQDMMNHWLKAAGILGIPTTFVVKGGKIIWIGHPIDLDSLMDPMLSGNFDVAAFKKKYEVKSEASFKSGNEMKAIMAGVQEAADAKDFKKAFQLVDEGISKMPFLNYLLKDKKFVILLNNFSEAETLNYGRELNKEDNSFLYQLAKDICDKDSLSKGFYLFAAGNLQTAIKERSYSGMYDMLALAFKKAGDLNAAVKAEEQAVIAAKDEVKGSKFPGVVFEYTVTDYEKKLADYRKALK